MHVGGPRMRAVLHKHAGRIRLRLQSGLRAALGQQTLRRFEFRNPVAFVSPRPRPLTPRRKTSLFFRPSPRPRPPSIA